MLFAVGSGLTASSVLTNLGSDLFTLILLDRFAQNHGIACLLHILYRLCGFVPPILPSNGAVTQLWLA